MVASRYEELLTRSAADGNNAMRVLRAVSRRAIRVLPLKANGTRLIAEPAVLFRQREPNSASAELEWRRLPYFRRVLWRNVVRAGARRPSAAFIARTFLRHSGSFARHFLRCAGWHVAAGEYGRARRAVLWACGASPLHVGLELVRNSGVRNTVLGALQHA